MPAQSTTPAPTLTDLLFERADVGLCLVAPDGTVLRANTAWLRSTPFSRDDVIGADIAALFPETRDMALAMHARARAGDHVQVPRHAQRVEGRESWWEGCIDPVPMEGGTGLLITARETTPDPEVVRNASELNWAEEALRESEERLRAAQDLLADGFSILRPVRDADGHVVDFKWVHQNKTAERIKGKTLQQLAGHSLLELFPGHRGTPLIEAYRHVAETGESRTAEALYQGNDILANRWFRVAVVPSGQNIAVLSQDITARKHAEEALRESEARYRLLFQNMLEGFAYCRMIFDDAGRPADFVYLDVNGAFAALTGLHDVVGKRVSEVIPGIWSAHPELLETYGRVARTGHAERFDIDFHPLETCLSVSVYGVQRDHFVAVFDNITERKRAENALREADRRKDEFLGMLSHELRNPLAPIRNSAYILRNAPSGSEKVQRAGEVIERQAEHLTRLVDDLLDVTRIARGKIALRRSRADLRQVVHRAAEDHRLAMEARGVAFRTKQPDTRIWADVDVTRVTQIVGNLLQNATKFTPRGGEVALTLGVVDGEAEVRVRDTGEGIDPALLPRLFAPFVQGDRTLARSEGGLGLGLALIKGIAELHGGTVRAESAGKGQGAEFIVRLPVAKPEPTQQDGRGGAAERSLHGRRVLIVDDNPDAAESLADLLRLQGHVAEVAYDGPSALAAVGASAPDAVLCDIGLPGMSGYEVARAVRAGSNGKVRLIAVSGYAQPEDVQRAIEAGFDAHVAKPPDSNELARLLG